MKVIGRCYYSGGRAIYTGPRESLTDAFANRGDPSNTRSRSQTFGTIHSTILGATSRFRDESAISFEQFGIAVDDGFLQESLKYPNCCDSASGAFVCKITTTGHELTKRNYLPSDPSTTFQYVYNILP